MKIKNINRVARKEKVYDIETTTHDYLLHNGVISHNTQEMFSKAVVSGGCLVSGTLIKMSDGALKEIESIVVGELVDTLEGPKEVTHIWDPETLETGEPECYEIEFDDGFKVICSSEHQFLTDAGWVKASEIYSSA